MYKQPQYLSGCGKLALGFNFRNNDSGQLHTLEAIMAAIVMIGVLIFAVQATTITPLTSSTANAHIESQLYTLGQDMVMALDHSQYDQDSQLKKEIIGWSGDEYVWNATHYKSRANGSDTISGPVNELLQQTLVAKGIGHNMEFTFRLDSENTLTSPYIYNGDPSDNAVIVSRKVVLSNNDIANTSSFENRTSIPDMDNTTDFYNIVDVKLTMWRM
ncbi:hypothetical protein SAMN06264941_1615 [Methanohalophilus portucalensis FDF-1]|uniref:Uncharacterized protein n=2 Tax=Methanohalophilus portucalensis FDF-1 TaxID=523843 RepID=A0A1X7NVB4_9EURY|nr:hypothetical protein SAMN06264941_1615 [Methanohalophilus portucalensis FDF-1]